MAFFFGNRCCCNLIDEPPISVESPCSSSGIPVCLIGSTDGTGVSVESNPFGGSSTLSSDPDWGRPGPGIKIEATQSGNDGCFTLLKIEDPLPYFFNCGEVMICGEFTKATPGDSFRVWPCIYDGSDVYVLSSTPTVVSSKTTWKGVSATFNLGSSSTDGLFVTGYNADGVTTSTDRIPSHVQIHAGFIVQSLGEDGEAFPFYLDNVCSWQDYNCPSSSCQVATMTIGEFVTSGNYTTPFDSDCWIEAAEHSLMNGVMPGSFLLSLVNFVPEPDPNPDGLGWSNAGSPLSDDCLVYDSGGEKVYLYLGVSIPVNGPSGGVVSGYPMIALIRLIHANDACSPAGFSPIVIGEWHYELSSDNFACDIPLEFSFNSESMGGSFDCDSHPLTLSVIFQAA